MSERVPTGIPELDKLIEGGFPRHAMILLAGGPGAGKTILSAKFLHEGALKYGEPGVYVCFAETKRMFIRDMKNFGMDFEALALENRVSILDLSIGAEIEVQSALNQIMEAVTSIRARRLVIDSITAMSVGLKSELEKRRMIHLLYRIIQNSGCTTIMITDMPYGTNRIGGGIEEFIADGIMMMQTSYNSEGVLRRHLRILKMRGTNHGQKTYEYTIGDNGVEINVS
ncbi:MAG: AAA family ATPase [Candidatus Bathyarchaeota archaeon]|nr:AAA family ATPase [Candidatus Bathyarchaeota archaeon]